MKSAVLSVAKKELLESFRDRQMILYGIVMPLAMYPVMFWVMIQGSLIVRGLSESTVVDVELVEARSGEAPAVLRETLSTERDAAEPSLARIDVVRTTVGDEVAAEQRLQDAEGERPDAVVVYERDGVPLKVLYDSTEGHSELARDRRQ